MASIWDVAPQIGTGLSLVAFVVAVGLYAYRARLNQRASVIAKMPARDRLAAIDATAEFLRVDVSGLSEKDKHDIVVRQLAIRSRRELMLAGIAIAIAVLLGAVAIIAILVEKGSSSPKPVAKCYKFDPQSGEQRKALGGRPCFPGKLVYLKYWDPNNYDLSWPSDRPNRVFQAKNIVGDGHVRWSEQDLTRVINKLETWGTQNHDWVTIVEDTGIGGGVIGFVLRRIDLQPVPVGIDKDQCASEAGTRPILEFAFPGDVVAQITNGSSPTVRMRVGARGLHSRSWLQSPAWA